MTLDPTRLVDIQTDGITINCHMCEAYVNEAARLANAYLHVSEGDDPCIITTTIDGETLVTAKSDGVFTAAENLLLFMDFVVTDTPEHDDIRLMFMTQTMPAIMSIIEDVASTRLAKQTMYRIIDRNKSCYEILCNTGPLYEAADKAVMWALQSSNYAEPGAAESSQKSTNHILMLARVIYDECNHKVPSAATNAALRELSNFEKKLEEKHDRYTTYEAHHLCRLVGETISEAYENHLISENAYLIDNYA